MTRLVSRMSIVAILATVFVDSVNSATLLEDSFSNGNTRDGWIQMTNGPTAYDYGSSGAATIVPGDAQPSALWRNFADTVLQRGQTLKLSFDVMSSSMTTDGGSIRFGLGYGSSPLTDGANTSTPVDGYMSSAPFLGSDSDCPNYWLDGDPVGMNWGNAATVFFADGALDNNDTYTIANTVLRTVTYEITRRDDDKLCAQTSVNGLYSSIVVYTETITNFKFNAVGLIAAYSPGITFTYDNVKVEITTPPLNSYTVGGYLLTRDSVEPRRNFSLSVDLLINQGESTAPPRIMIGNLIDGPYVAIPFATDGRSVDNDIYWVTNLVTGGKTALLQDYGQAYLDETGYHVELQWVSTNGRSGVLSMEVFETANSNLVNSFSLEAVQLPNLVQFGGVTASGKAAFENARVVVLQGTALLKYWITTSAPLEANSTWPNNPESVFPISKLDFRNLDMATDYDPWWNEGEIGDKENDLYKKFARIQGYVVPPETGTYTFYVAGRDAVSFYLSSSESTNVQKIAYTGTGGSDYQDWDADPSQSSTGILLTAGQRYYFELQYDALRGAYHADQSFSAAWSGPGIARRVLSGNDMQFYYPWKDVPKPERNPNGYQGLVGTWINYWYGSSEGWWTPNLVKYWINGQWTNLDYTNLEHINDALNQLVAAGIDFVILDMTNNLRWYGRSRTIQMMAAHKGLKFCFARSYADSHNRVGGSAVTDEEIWSRFVGRSYFGNQNHLFVDDRPLTVIYAVATEFEAEQNRTDNWARQFAFVSADGYARNRELWGWQLRSDGAITNDRGMFVSGAIKAYNIASVTEPWRNSYHFQDYNWLLAKTHNTGHIIAGSWCDIGERNMWCIIDQDSIADETARMPDQVGNIDRISRYDRVRQWINETPYVVPGGILRDGAYKMLSRSSGYALRLDAVFDASAGPQAGYYTQPAAYSNGCAFKQDTVINNIQGYIWISHLGSNEYKLFPAHLGLPLEASNSSDAMVTGLHQDLNLQRWIAETTGDGYFRFRNKATGQMINSTGTSLGARVNQTSASGGQNQEWQMAAVRTMPSMGLWNGSFENRTVFDGTNTLGVVGWEMPGGNVFAVNPSDGAAIQPTRGNNYSDLNMSTLAQTTELNIESNADYLLLFDVYPKSSGDRGSMAVIAVDSDLSENQLYSETGYGMASVPAFAWTSRQIRLRASALGPYAGQFFRLQFHGDIAIDAVSLIKAPAYSYSEWLMEHALSGAETNMTADLDSDGLNNFEEYALGGNPQINDAASMAPQFSVNADSADFVYRRRTDDSRLHYELWLDDDLVAEPGWTNAGSIYEITPPGITETPGVEIVTNRVSTAEKTKQFFQLILRQND